MNFAGYLASALIVAGTVMLACSLQPASQIIGELPPGSSRRRWVYLRGLIAFFILGYLAALVFLPAVADIEHLIAAAVFLCGAVFVLIVCRLMLATVHDCKRISRLESENITDPLVGIYNRRHLEERLQQESARARRYTLPLSVCIVDVDHFKRFNDEHGHETGDQVLRTLGRILRETTRAIDVAARYGGEEFVILLPTTGEAEAKAFAERLRQRIEQAQLAGGAPARGALRGTVSVGVATASGECDGWELLNRADRALYQAKRAGRNRVVVFEAGRAPAGA